MRKEYLIASLSKDKNKFVISPVPDKDAENAITIVLKDGTERTGDVVSGKATYLLPGNVSRGDVKHIFVDL